MTNDHLHHQPRHSHVEPEGSDEMSGVRTENVRVPVGLIEELMTWCDDELNHAMRDTQYRADLTSFYDELLSAKEWNTRK